MIHYFCPHCKQVQPIRAYFDGTSEVARCQVCGYPLEGEGVVVPPAPQAKLLFIDADPLLRGFFRHFARAHGFQPFIAPDGPAGIALATLERPDLIILEARLPGVDGVEVCRRLRAEPDLQTTPILLVTALEDPTISAQGMKVGATLALTKPLEPQQFLDTIKTALTLRPPPPPAA